MLTTRRRWAGRGLGAVLALTAGGCGLAPSDWLYSVAVAKIGDTYHVIAPMCADERLASIEIYDNAARNRATSAPADPTAFTYWLAEQPVTAQAQRGVVTVGDDKSFARVPVEAGAKAPLPTGVLGLRVQVTWPEGTKGVGDAMELTEVPSYPATADPATVKYAIDDDEGESRLLTPAEIEKSSERCARENA
jgi:hypothetical protein